MALFSRSLRKVVPFLQQSIQHRGLIGMSSSLKPTHYINRKFSSLRGLSSMTTPNQSSAKPQTKVETITVTIVTSEDKIPVTAKIGETLYDAIERAKAVDGYGACDGKING